MSVLTVESQRRLSDVTQLMPEVRGILIADIQNGKEGCDLAMLEEMIKNRGKDRVRDIQLSIAVNAMHSILYLDKMEERGDETA